MIVDPFKVARARDCSVPSDVQRGRGHQTGGSQCWQTGACVQGRAVFRYFSTKSVYERSHGYSKALSAVTPSGKRVLYFQASPPPSDDRKLAGPPIDALDFEMNSGVRLLVPSADRSVD